MVKLNEFQPGSLILSSEVNTNFDKLVEILGASSNDEKLVLPGRIAFGQRQAATISALTDRAANTKGYLHFGWNAKEVFTGSGKVDVARVVNRESATFMRMGTDGLSVYGTATESGDLNPEKMKLFQIKANADIFVHPDASFTGKSGSPNSIDDYRLTLSPLSSPVEILNIGWTRDYNALKRLSLGIKNYHGVELRIEAKRGNNNDTPPVIQISGEGLDARLGFMARVNDVGTSLWQGRAFFLRTEEDKNHDLRIKVSDVISGLAIYVIGVWK